MDSYLPPYLRPALHPYGTTDDKELAATYGITYKPLGQSRKASALEIVISTAVGFGLSLAIGHWLFPAMFHVNVSHETNIIITAIFTGASLARGYFMRRVFNWWHCRFG